MRLAAVLVLLSHAAVAQLLSPLESLVKTEMGFARMSVEKNTRAAFLAHLDEKSIVFQDGKAVAGKELWTSRPEGNGYLFWWPVTAAVSFAGDLGYTTGPAEYGPDRNSRKASGGLYYATVWRKTADGRWKIAADLGSAVYEPEEQKPQAKWPEAETGTASAKAVSLEDLFKIEQAYISKLNSSGKSFHADSFHERARLYRADQPPFIGKDIRKAKSQGTYKLTPGQGNISRSGDLGYFYGDVQLINGTDTLKSNYLRIWKKSGPKWDIVLDAISAPVK